MNKKGDRFEIRAFWKKKTQQTSVQNSNFALLDFSCDKCSLTVTGQGSAPWSRACQTELHSSTGHSSPSHMPSTSGEYQSSNLTSTSGQSSTSSTST